MHDAQVKQASGVCTETLCGDVKQMKITTSTAAASDMFSRTSSCVYDKVYDDSVCVWGGGGGSILQFSCKLRKQCIPAKMHFITC